MKLFEFQADVLFDDSEYLFCEDLEEGFQLFRSWAEFIDLYIAHMKAPVKPLYVHPATLVDDVDYTNVFVDGSHFILIPWDEIENYI